MYNNNKYVNKNNILNLEITIINYCNKKVL